MKENIMNKILEHEKWVDSLGEKGEKLVLDEIDFREQTLRDRIMNQAYITACNFNDMNLVQIDFSWSLMCSSTFNWSTLRDCIFYKSNLGFAEFKEATFYECDLHKSDCSDTVFRDAIFKDTRFVDALLYKTDFSGSIMENVEFTLAYIEEATFNGVRMKAIKGIEEANIKSINIGTTDEPQMLYGDEAKQWLMNQAEKVL